MKIVILGSTGQVGTYITSRIRADYPTSNILACVRNLKEGGFLFRPFEDDWSKLGEVDVIINSVGIINETKELTFEKAHKGLTELILKNRALMGNPRIIQISVLGADVNSKVPFMSTKAMADELLLQKPNSAIVRPSIVCTPGTMIVQKFRMLKKMSRLMFGFLLMPGAMLKTKMQPVMGEDVAEIVSALCASKATGIINAAGPEVFTLQQLLAYLPGRLRFIKVSKWLVGPVIGLITKLAPSVINEAQYELLYRDNIADKNGAESLLGHPLQSTRRFWQKELS